MSSTILDALQWRHAAKSFDTTKHVSEKDLSELLEVLRLSPSSYGIQPWKFVVVTDPEVRKQLSPAAYNQAQITQSDALIVLCRLKTLEDDYIRQYAADIAKQRGLPEDKLAGYRDMMLGSFAKRNQEERAVWMEKQVYIALGMLLEACALKKIESCPMEGFDSAKFDEILKLSELGLHSVVLCAIGMRNESDHHALDKKVRWPLETIVKEI